MQRNSICFLIPYFGQWPEWMTYFILGCERNPTIDWVLFTDCGKLENCPENVKIIETSFSDYCQLVSQKLDVDFSPVNPYKLCDIKPCLGFIHENEIKYYDFWAFGDIDVMYGDLRAYFTDERLMYESLFSTHARRISGHLCLIKNNVAMRSAFKRVNNWKKLLEAEEHVAFDEKAFSKVFLRHKNSPKWYQSLFKCIDPWLRLGQFEEAFSTPNAKVAWLDGSLNFPSTWIWLNGQMTNNLTPNKQFPYFHFLNWKNKWNRNEIKPISQSQTVEKIYFTQSGINKKP